MKSPKRCDIFLCFIGRFEIISEFHNHTNFISSFLETTSEQHRKRKRMKMGVSGFPEFSFLMFWTQEISRVQQQKKVPSWISISEGILGWIFLISSNKKEYGIFKEITLYFFTPERFLHCFWQFVANSKTRDR